MNLEEIIDRVKEIKGWFHDYQMKIIYPYIKDLPAGGLFVEIGTFRGKSTLFYRLSNPGLRIITIDLFKEYLELNGETYHAPEIDPEVLREGNIFSVNGSSWDVVKGFNMEIDGMFIDAQHTEEAVKKDIEAWTPFVKKNGVVIFHDYTQQFSGVIRAVDAWMKDNEEWKTEFADLKKKIYIARRI